jgi:hypothetical protein
VFELVGISNFLIWTILLYRAGFRLPDWPVYTGFWIIPVLLLTPLLYHAYRRQARIEAQAGKARRQRRISRCCGAYLELQAWPSSFSILRMTGQNGFPEH